MQFGRLLQNSLPLVSKWMGRPTTRRLMGLGVGTLLMMKLSESRYANFYSDKVLDDAKSTINREIEAMKKKHGEQIMTFPQVGYSYQGGTYRIEYLVDQRKCDIFSLLVTAANIIEVSQSKAKNNPKPFSTVKTLQSDNVMTFQLEFAEEGPNTVKQKGTVSIIGEFRHDRPAFKFVLEKQTEITQADINVITETYKLANLSTVFSVERTKNVNLQAQKLPKADKKEGGEGFFNSFSDLVGKKNPEKEGEEDENDPVKKLKEMGVVVFMPDQKGYLEGLSWDMLAGYESQKRDIEDTVLLSLSHSDIFDEITRQTRARFEKNRAKAVLFEGPPGTGKTTSAKIIASQVGIPLLYLPLESVMSKWYGDSEKRLADVFELAGRLGRSIVFIDEIDALAQGRSEETHEVSRRILSTLLRKIDSFESQNETLLICATNRKQDLDRAILSRIDLSIKFDLPDANSRKEIFRRYALHLPEEYLDKLAQVSDSLSGRNIYEICKDSERRWASKRIRKETEVPLPPFEQYIESIQTRLQANLS